MKVNAIFLSGLIMSLLIALPVRGSAVDDLGEKYKSRTTEEERLKVCIDAISEKVIRIGMPVSDMDKIFGTKYAVAYRPRPKGHIESGVINIAHTPSHWYLAFDFDDTCAVVRYELSDCDWKHDGGGVMHTGSIKQLVDQYKLASSERERLNVCVDAIKQRMIYYHMPLDEVTQILGSTWLAEMIYRGSRTSAMLFADRPDGWRLYVTSDGSQVTSYFLTNIDCKAWAEVHGVAPPR